MVNRTSSENENGERLLRAVDVGRVLNCSKRSVFRYCCSGRIPSALRLSGATRWKNSDIELFLQCDCDMPRFHAKRGAEDAK